MFLPDSVMSDINLLYCFDLFGTAVFALSGVLVAARKKMDFIGVMVLAAAVAIGGGTLRDLILGARPIFWIADNTYLYVILASCVLGVLGLKFLDDINNRLLLPVFDAVGLASFLGIGLTKSLQYGTSYLIAIILGTMTGVGGGIIRDTLAREIPFVLQKEIYATACVAGGVSLVAALQIGLPENIALVIGILVTLVIRLAAIFYSLRLPEVKL